MMDDCRYLFVYGSLRRVFNHPMHDWLVRYASWVGDATFGGRLFSLGAYPGAVPTSQPTAQVKGEVYEVLDATALFAQLDDYEDFLPENPTASLYLRQIHEIGLTDGRRIPAWVYVYNRPVIGLPQVASGDWRDEKEEREEEE